MLVRLLVIAFLSLPVSPTPAQSTQRYTVIPRPAQLEPRAGEFTLGQNTEIRVPVGRIDIDAITWLFAELTQAVGQVPFAKEFDAYAR